MNRFLKLCLELIALVFLVYSCSRSSGPEVEPEDAAIELNVSDILLRTQSEALPGSTSGSRTTLLLVHEAWSRLKDSLNQENRPSSLTLIQGKDSFRMICSDEVSAALAGEVKFVMEDNDMASIVAASANPPEELEDILSGIETVPDRSELLPPAPDNSPLRVYPEMTEVNLQVGADFVVITEQESYIFQACYHAPALGSIKKYIVEDCFDKSFVQYEDEYISMEQTSGREYHFVVKPIPGYQGESFSLTFFLLPAYLDHYLLKDGTVTILCH